MLSGAKASGYFNGVRLVAGCLIVSTGVLTAMVVRRVTREPGSRLRSAWLAARTSLDPAQLSRAPVGPWGGTELVVFFIGSPTCGASKDVAVGRLLPGLRDRLRQQVTDSAVRRLTYVGVALGTSIELGLDFLRAAGPFDEVSAGGGWVNQVAVEYLHRGQPGEVAIPQIVAVTRKLGIALHGHVVGTDSLLFRVVGATAIGDWLRGGAKLPRT